MKTRAMSLAQLSSPALDATVEVRLDLGDYLSLEAQLLLDPGIPFHHCRQFALERLSREYGPGQRDQQICHLDVAGRALPRRGDHHDLPQRVRFDNLNNLLNLPGIRQGRTTEFCNLHTNSLPMLVSGREPRALYLHQTYSINMRLFQDQPLCGGMARSLPRILRRAAGV
jgi:hypothetical protein